MRKNIVANDTELFDVTMGIICADKTGSGTYLWLAMGIANYAVAVRRKRVAVAAPSGSGALGNLAWYFGIEPDTGTGSFCLFGVDYYLNYRESDYYKIAGKHYNYIILFEGQHLKNSISGLMRCRKKIVVGSLNSWRNKEYTEMLQSFSAADIIKNEITYYAEFFEDKDRKIIEKQFGISLKKLPDRMNPFQIKRGEFAFYDEFL